MHSIRVNCLITKGHIFQLMEVFRRGRSVDDFVHDFERQPGEETWEVRHEIQHFVETLRGSGLDS